MEMRASNRLLPRQLFNRPHLPGRALGALAARAAPLSPPGALFLAGDAAGEALAAAGLGGAGRCLPLLAGRCLPALAGRCLPFEGVAPALSKRLGDVIAGLKGSAVSVLIAQSDLNHSRKLVDAEFVIERGANVTLAAA